MGEAWPSLDHPDTDHPDTEHPEPDSRRPGSPSHRGCPSHIPPPRCTLTWVAATLPLPTTGDQPNRKGLHTIHLAPTYQHEIVRTLVSTRREARGVRREA